jgi:hypothetical protein
MDFLKHFSTELLTPWSTIIPVILIASRLIKNFLVYESRSYTTVFRRDWPLEPIVSQTNPEYVVQTLYDQYQ